MYIVSIVGAHKTGKTTYCEMLIQRAKSDGFIVSAIKSSSESLDLQTTDTKRLMNAGAEQVVFTSPKDTAIFLRHEAAPEKLFERFHLYPDLLLIEGYKSMNCPKFLIAKEESDLHIDVTPETIIAVVCPKALHQSAHVQYPHAQLFEREDIPGLYKKLRGMYIEYYAASLPEKDCRKCGFDTCKDYAKALMENRAELGRCSRTEKNVRVSVDSEELSLSTYPRAVLSAVIRSLVETLSGVPVGYKRIDVLIEDSAK